MTTTRGAGWMQAVALVSIVLGVGVSIYMLSEVVTTGPSLETLFPAGAWVLMTIAWVVNFIHLRRPMPEGIVPESAEADRPSFT